MFLPWQGAKTILIRSTYLQGLLEVNSCCRCWCFVKAPNERTVQNESLVLFFLEVADNEVEFLPVEFLEVVEDVRPRNSRQQMFQGCIICNLNLHTFGDHAPHG